MRSVLAKQLAANYIGEIWVTLAQFAIIPVYIHYLGVEAYGLIGVYTTLTAFAALSNLGITPAFGRGVSRLSGIEGGSFQIRSFIWTLEIVYWGICVGATFVGMMWLSAPVSDWVNPGSFDVTFIRHIVVLMFAQIGLQLMVGFYTGGLLGMHCHILVNLINIGGVSLRLLGAAFVLAFISPTLDALFWWLITGTALHSIAMAVAIHRRAPDGPQAFNREHIQGIWRYASGLTATVVLSLILTQIDKLILSRTLSLADFGVYALASNIAMAIGKPLGPLSRTFLPRMIQLAAQGDDVGLARSYHQGSQLASLVVMPATALICINAAEFMSVVFPALPEAASVARLVAILSVGFCGLSLMAMPYILTLARGWVQFGFYQNLIACAFLIPAMFVMVGLYEAIGAGMVWATLTVAYLLVSPYFLHRRLLPREYSAWYLRDMLPPAATSILMALALSMLPLFGHGWILDAATLFVCYLIISLATLLSLDLIRAPTLAKLRRMSLFGV